MFLSLGKAALRAAFPSEGEIVNPARCTRRRAGFYWNCSRCARILLKAFYFWCNTDVSGIARLRGSRACSADGQQDFRCAVRLRPTFFPLNNIVFAPSQKHLMHLECIKRAYYVRPTTAHVRRRIGWLLPVLCTSFVNIFKTLLLHVALLPEKW